MDTLVRYRSTDGDRRVVVLKLPGADRPFALADEPDHDRWAGVHFLLESYATREEAQEAAEAYADLAVELGTYEARAVNVGLCSLGDLR